MIIGCLNGDTRLIYYVELLVDGGIRVVDTVSKSSSELPVNSAELQFTGLEITITPAALPSPLSDA